MNLTPITGTPSDTPDNMVAAGTAGIITTRAGVSLRLHAFSSGDGATVVARPWQYIGGHWEPLRADGGGAGPAPVTATTAAYAGWGNGIFMCGPTAVPMCVVLESGDSANVSFCDLSEYFARS